MVRRIEPTTDCARVLKRHDVLLAFDGVPIAGDGTVPFRTGERIAFSYLVSQKFVGDEAALRVLSGGAERTLRVKLAAPARLVPFHLSGRPPQYFIVGGLVFTAVSVPYLRSEYGARGGGRGRGGARCCLASPGRCTPLRLFPLSSLAAALKPPAKSIPCQPCLLPILPLLLTPPSFSLPDNPPLPPVHRAPPVRTYRQGLRL